MEGDGRDEWELGVILSQIQTMMSQDFIDQSRISRVNDGIHL